MVQNNVLCVAIDGCVKEISPAGRRTVHQKIEEPPLELFTVDVDKSSTHYATGGRSTLINYYDAGTQTLLKQMKESKCCAGHANRVQAVKFSPYKEELILTGGWDSTLILYDALVGEPVLSVVGPNVFGESLDFHPNSPHLILAGTYTQSDPLLLFDIRNLKEPVMSIDWCGGGIKTGKEWTKRNEEWEDNKKIFGENAAFLYSAKFSCDGDCILAGGGVGKNQLRAFDSTTG